MVGVLLHPATSSILSEMYEVIVQSRIFLAESDKTYKKF